MLAFVNIFLYEFLWREATVSKCEAFSNLALNSYDILIIFLFGFDVKKKDLKDVSLRSFLYLLTLFIKVIYYYLSAIAACAAASLAIGTRNGEQDT